jgi:hypothetical protein
MAEPQATNELRRVDRRELVLGRPLPGHLRDRSGRILIRAGRRLSENHLRVLQERGVSGVYADLDWPPPPTVAEADTPTLSPRALVQALTSRRNHRATDRGRVRRRPRRAWQAELLVIVEQFRDGLKYRRQIKATTRDVSVAGFSFVCQQYVHLNTIVHARFDMLPSQPVMKGIVRNCAHLSGRAHRVGVEFIGLEPDEITPYA